MGFFIATVFALASFVLFNELCKLTPGGSLPARVRRIVQLAFGRRPEPRVPYTSEVPGMRWAGERYEPVAIVWDEPEETRELWPLSSLADELPPEPALPAPRRRLSAMVDDDLEQATVPRG